MSPQTPHHVLTSEMFATPPKAYHLPSYTSGLAKIFAEAPSPIQHHNYHYNSRVLDFVDVETRQGDDSDASSSQSV